MSPSSLPAHFLSLPKAELHLHLEGSIEPATVCALAARHGQPLAEQEARRRYSYANFMEFIEAFKWVTSYLRDPEDYALITRELGKRLLAQNVVYAELTLSVGIMFLRQQQPEANFEAMCRASEELRKQGLRLQWIFDAVRQFGAEAAMQVARIAPHYRNEGVVAFGIGGDELSLPTADFRAVYDYVAEQGLHRLIHAGETGGPQLVREAVELLGAERIGHGLGAMHDPALLEMLAERRIPLELCPTSNICTGALARQLTRGSARIAEHPLPNFLRQGLAVVLSTDDPAMFHTSLLAEYAHTAAMGLTEAERDRLAALSFEHAFLPAPEKRALAAARPGAHS
ncbi:MAG: adenosine deaminase [Acidobacteriia bacterium]|nr:adenosine deaminase [Terriglobia bacterium]